LFLKITIWSDFIIINNKKVTSTEAFNIQNEKVRGTEVLRLFNENYLTGEVEELDLSNFSVIDKTEAQRIREQKRAFLEKKALLGSLSERSFVWAIYQTSTLLLEQLSSTFVTMLFYLITYCGYSGFLTSGKQPICRDQLEEVLGVGRTTAWKFWNAISELGLCIEADDKSIVVNKDFFRRGEIKKSEIAEMASNDTYVTKLYINAIRSLYESATVSSRKTLCYLFQVMPYVNRQYNIICHNPLEKNLKQIRPMNLGEVCNVLGYSDENTSRLLSALLDAKFNSKDGIESAMRYVVSDRLRDRRSYNMFVNPNVYYAGTRWDEVKVLGQF